MRKSTVDLYCLALLVLTAGLVQAQGKPDFSGTWKIDPAKSDFGPAPPPDTMVQKIVHTEPNIKVNLVQTGGTGDMSLDLVYTTDGKESLNHMGDNEVKTKLK